MDDLFIIFSLKLNLYYKDNLILYIKYIMDKYENLHL